MKKALLFSCIPALFAVTARAQSYNMPAGNGVTVTVNTCSGTFRDNGGGAGNYSNNQNSSYTFLPAVAGQYIMITFTLLDVENGFDFLYVYDGPAGPLRATYTGTPALPTITASSNSITGGLTVRFRSDGSVVRPGWIATVSCVAAPAAPPAFTPSAQDCQQGGGTTICSNTTFSGNSSGDGNVNDLAAPWDGCLAGENQSSWYYFSPSTSGTIGFTIAPANGTDDYDFAVWGPFSDVTCPVNTGQLPLRCSYAAGGGNTGCGNGAMDVSEGAGGNRWVASFAVTAGDIYVLVVDNFSSSASPFDLTWNLGGGASLDCTVLPVEFLSFTGERVEDHHHLEWKTGSEINNDYFAVERSVNGEPFEEIGRTDGAGYSSQVLSYAFNDLSPVEGVNYYRIRQVDVNGQSSVSSMIALSYHTTEVYIENIHPMPTNGDVSFDFVSPQETEISYVITDIAGRVVTEQKMKTGAGRTTVHTRIADNNSGIYMLRVTDLQTGAMSVARLAKY